MSDSYLTLTQVNSDLREDKEILEERSARLEEQSQLLNRTSVQLQSINLNLSLENSELMEKIENLTLRITQLTQEHEQLVQFLSEQEEKRLNMSETIKHLVSANTQLQEERQQLSETNSLLRGGCFKKRRRAESSQKPTTEQNQNLSMVVTRERQELLTQEGNRRKEMEQMVVDMKLVNASYRSLDLYCPVVNQKSRERMCKKCQDSWRLFETKCYYFSSRMLSWSSSRAWCQTQGGDLLIINSQQEQEFVFDASRAGEQLNTRLWIGMTDAEEEGDWRWVDSSKVNPDVQFWLSRPGMVNEPDDWKLDDPLGEDCGHLDTSEDALMSWMDSSCKKPYRWICKKNL
ncbi:hypothetical protein INR49_005831 [Caranx melampygus]|nr:hypothetical protein INR49_005831 [Caranx melampygus]